MGKYAARIMKSHLCSSCKCFETLPYIFCFIICSLQIPFLELLRLPGPSVSYDLQVYTGSLCLSKHKQRSLEMDPKASVNIHIPVWDQLINAIILLVNKSGDFPVINYLVPAFGEQKPSLFLRWFQTESYGVLVLHFGLRFLWYLSTLHNYVFAL